jgi:hypothetical protein
VPGKFGNALRFDGVNDWVTINDLVTTGVAATTVNGPLDLTTGMTLSAWVSPESFSGWETVLMKERGSVGAGLLSYALYAHDGAPLALGAPVPAGYVRVNPVGSTTDRAVRGINSVPLNTWTHLATTYSVVGNVQTQAFFVNGVQVGTTTVTAATTGMVVSNGPIRIGGNASSSQEFYQGLIDEVRVYNRALSAAEITTDMNTAIVR